MEQAAFDAMMEKEFGSVAAKRAGLNNASSEKRSNLRPTFEQSTPAIMDRFEDADTIGLRGQEDDSRLVGYDAYETYHPGQLEDPIKGPATRRRLDRQKKRYSKEFGVDAGSVEDADIYEQGAREGLTALTNLTKQEGDSPLSLGPMDYYRNHPLGMDSADSRLGLNVNVAQNGTGKYGRHLTTAFNPNDKSNINDLSENQYNSAIYNDSGFDKKATKDRRTFLETGKSYSDMTREEKNQYNIEKYGGSQKGRVENFIDAAQYGVGRTASGIADAFVDTATWMVKAGYKGITGEDEKNATKWINDNASLFTRDKNGDFVGLDDYGEAKEYDYDNSRTKAATADFGKAFDSGDYGQMVGSIANGLVTAGPEFFLESAGEILAVMSGTKAAQLAAKGTKAATAGSYALSSAGSVALSSKYANEIMEERKKNLNGEELSPGDRAFAIATGGVVAMLNKLGGDEILGNTKLIKSLVDLVGKPGGKVVASQVLKTIAGKTAEVTGKGIYEGLEEIAQEFTQKVGEKYGTDAQKELMTSETGKELFQAFGGGFAGGLTPSATSNTIGATLGAPRAAAQILKNKREHDVGEYLVGEDGKLGKAFDDMTFKGTTEFKEQTKEAVKEVDKINSFEDALNSSNPVIRRVARGLSEIKDDKDVEAGSEKHIKNIGIYLENAIKKGKDLSELDSELGITVNESTSKEITDAIFAMPKEGRDSLIGKIQPDIVNRTASQKINDEGNFAELKKRMIEVVRANDKAADMKVDEMNSQLKNIKEGRKSSPTEIKEGKINTGKINKAQPKGKIANIIDTLAGIPNLTRPSVKKAMKELNTYSDDSLKEASDSKETPKSIKRLVDLVINKRKKVKELSKFDTTDDFSPRNQPTTLYKGDKQKTLDILRKGLSKKEYTDKRDVDAMKNIINSALEQDFITEAQHETFHARIKKIGSGLKALTDKQLKEEADADTKHEEETGLGKKTRENLSKEEVSKADIDEELKELNDKGRELFENEEYARIRKISKEDRTEEDNKFFDKTSKKITEVKARLNELQEARSNFSQHETDMNDAYTVMEEEWFYKNAEVYNLENAFTKEEKTILGIC